MQVCTKSCRLAKRQPFLMLCRFEPCTQSQIWMDLHCLISVKSICKLNRSHFQLFGTLRHSYINTTFERELSLYTDNLLKYVASCKSQARLAHEDIGCTGSNTHTDHVKDYIMCRKHMLKEDIGNEFDLKSSTKRDSHKLRRFVIQISAPT